LVVPFYLTSKVGGGIKTFVFFGLITFLPILVAFWTAASTFSPRKNTKAKFPGKSIEHYLEFHREEDTQKYKGNVKIPMETFHEMYFQGDVSFKGDCLDIMEYRHDWASFEFTYSLFKYFLTGMIPEVLMHTRGQGNFNGPLMQLETFDTMQMRNRSEITTIVVMTSTAGSWVRV
jgi:hypothetical protein